MRQIAERRCIQPAFSLDMGLIARIQVAAGYSSGRARRAAVLISGGSSAYPVPSSRDSSDALPPAAVVSMVRVRSVAKRWR